MVKKIEKEYVIMLTISLLLYVAIMAFILNIFYTTTRDDLLVIGDKTSVASVHYANEFIKENIDIIGLGSESVEYIMENSNNNEAIKDYLTESTNGYIAGIDENFTGFYGFFNGEYLDGTSWVPDEEFDPKERPWYKTAVEADGETAITSPYLDEQTQTIMISIVRLLKDKESVIAIDISLDTLDELVSDIYKEGYARCVILDDKGMVVASSQGNKGVNYLRGDSGPEKQTIAENAFRTEQSCFEGTFNNRESIIFSYSIYGNWHSILIMDKGEVFQKTYRNMIICIVVSLVMMILLVYFCRYSNRKRYDAEKSSKLLKSLSEIYVSVNYIDIAKNSFEVISGEKFVYDLIKKSNGKATDTLDLVLENTVEKEYLEDTKQFIDLKTLPARLSGKSTITFEFPGKTIGWCQARFINIDNEKSVNNVFLAIENINETKTMQERLITESTVDKLTGCYNRRAYEDDLSAYEGTTVSDNLVYFSVDVNGLKDVNDDAGHDAGDELVAGAANCLKSVMKSYGKVYRTGGDEFIAIIEEEDNLNHIVSNLHNRVDKWSGFKVDSLTISVGYAAKKDNPGMSIRELAELADKNMYEDKARYYMTKGIDRRGQKEAYDSICDSYAKILLVNLTLDAYKTVKVDPKEQTEEYGYNDKISLWMKGFALTGHVGDEDRDEFLAKTDIDYLRDYFASSDDRYSIHYRRIINNESVNAMMEMIPTHKFDKGNKVVFLFVKNI